MESSENQRRKPTSIEAIERREGHFAGHGGDELFYQTWTPQNRAARGTLVITHGISEHSECYLRTAEALTSMGWNICAWDLRGHGRSEGKRGYVEDFHNYALDLGYLLRYLRKNSKLPDAFALIGHSMGGLITLRHLADNEAETPVPQALVLSAPALGFSISVPKVKDLAARVFNRVLPSITLYNEIRYEILTHDTELLKKYEADAMRHDKISPAVYLGMIEAFGVVRAAASKLSMPVLIQAAGKEQVVSPSAIEDYFPTIASANKKMIVYRESFHEIYNDLERERAFADLDAFIGAALRTE